MAEGSHPGTKPQTGYSGVKKNVLAARCVKMIIASYRKDQFADAPAFIEQLYEVLMQWPESVIEAVADPRRSRSVQQSYTFPPSLKEVVDLCSEEAEVQRKLREAAHQPRSDRNRNRDYVPPPNFPGCRCNVFVHADAPQYPALWEWSQLPDTDARDWKLDERGRLGVWVALSIFQTIGTIRQRSSNWKTPSDGELRESLARLAGVKPALEIDA